MLILSSPPLTSMSGSATLANMARDALSCFSCIENTRGRRRTRAFLIAFLAHILCTDHLTKHWPSVRPPIFSKALGLQVGQMDMNGEWLLSCFGQNLAKQLKRNCFLLSSKWLPLLGVVGEGVVETLIYVFMLVHFFCSCFFFGAVRPLGFVCAQSTLGHKWNVASAPLGKRKKLIVLCSLGGLKNHQAHTYSIKKRRTTWRWRLFCTLKKNGVHDLHDTLACMK